ncbi:hypothetical protein IRZ83_02125 [Flavobacterium sp. JLP]|uniref:hypothetical protein n=1 Tax=Flavobacterium sp. JLP TaxID=2783793 RepID=UPI00188A9E15|nr:hypothetical protein [Flavobacterium sp. JLP]MBF4505445.1 hypothetical protein [Flavobacterium sp. JLP]
MNTIDNNNSTIKGNRDPRNQSQNANDKNTLMNEEMYNIDDVKKSDNDNSEIAERGYTVRNGTNPDIPNPDQISDDDLDDLDDDFHTQRDLEDNEDYIYEVELEDDELDANGNELNEVNDEFDNPSDDFNETEDDLEDIDQDDDEEEEEEDDEYMEDDVQEEDEEYQQNDPRKF